jgi:serine/threonine-protein kinase RsbW
VPDTSGAEVSAEFSAERDAPRGARHFVADILARGGHAGTLLEDAELLVTELATNAVIHAHSPFSIVVRAEHSRVRISVSDTSAVRPAQRDEGPMATSGRGLRLVAALSVDWGVEVTADGKTVWPSSSADRARRAAGRGAQVDVLTSSLAIRCATFSGSREMDRAGDRGRIPADLSAELVRSRAFRRHDVNRRGDLGQHRRRSEAVAGHQQPKAQPFGLRRS